MRSILISHERIKIHLQRLIEIGCLLVNDESVGLNCWLDNQTVTVALPQYNNASLASVKWQWQHRQH